MHRKLVLTSSETSYPVPGLNKQDDICLSPHRNKLADYRGSSRTPLPTPPPCLMPLASVLKNSHRLKHSSPAIVVLFSSHLHTALIARAAFSGTLPQPVGGVGMRPGGKRVGCVIKRLHSGTHSQIYTSQLGTLC